MHLCLLHLWNPYDASLLQVQSIMRKNLTLHSEDLQKDGKHMIVLQAYVPKQVPEMIYNVYNCHFYEFLSKKCIWPPEYSIRLIKSTIWLYELYTSYLEASVCTIKLPWKQISPMQWRVTKNVLSAAMRFSIH
jgi:hypothetical protein